MSISTGFANLQIDANDKTKTAKFKVSYHSTSKSLAKAKATKLRDSGKKARIVKEGKEYVVYVRS